MNYLLTYVNLVDETFQKCTINKVSIGLHYCFIIISYIYNILIASYTRAH